MPNSLCALRQVKQINRHVTRETHANINIQNPDASGDKVSYTLYSTCFSSIFTQLFFTARGKFSVS